MALCWRKPAATVGERARRRITLHVVPYLFFLYILAYLDRANIAAAQLGMKLTPAQGGLGFNSDIIGIGVGMFFWGYWILEIPSTLSVERWGARWIFVRILILWGLCAAALGAIGTPAMSAVLGWIPTMAEPEGWVGGPGRWINGLAHDPKQQFYFFRFMLGFFEGGFFPSVIVYLSRWFGTWDRARAIGGFALAMPLAGVVSAPLSGRLLGVNWFGVAGWRWVFIVEGIVPVLAGVATIWLLPNRPEEVSWLADDERQWLAEELEQERRLKREAAASGVGWRDHLPLVAMLTAVYFCQNVTVYGLVNFMPGIIEAQLGGLPYSVRSLLGLAGKIAPEIAKNRANVIATYLTIVPYCMAVVGMLIFARHSDRTRERTWHAAVPLALTSLGILLSWWLRGWPLASILLLIFFVGTFLYAHLPAFWPIPTVYLGASAAASAIAFINMTGNMGGVLGPRLVGDAAVETNLFAAMGRLIPWSAAGAVILVIADLLRRRRG